MPKKIQVWPKCQSAATKGIGWKFQPQEKKKKKKKPAHGWPPWARAERGELLKEGVRRAPPWRAARGALVPHHPEKEAIKKIETSLKLHIGKQQNAEMATKKISLLLGVGKKIWGVPNGLHHPG
jgi:hypothetical protein